MIYHFMFHPDWEAGCKSCSFWADGYDRMVVHLKARDVSMATVSRAPIGKLKAFREQMGWGFTWVCSAENSFNRDFGVLFTPAEITSGETDYNYHRGNFPVEDAPGISVFA